MSRSSKKQLLKSLLAPLIQEWGEEQVRRCLAELRSELNDDANESVVKTRRQKESLRHQQPNAVELANGAAMPERRKLLVLTIASKFDTKAFLPTSADVRHFLEMRGQRASVIKDRRESFRQVLESLMSMDDEELRVLAETDAHGGPTQLGPLSDAIKATGTAMRTPRMPLEDWPGETED